MQEAEPNLPIYGVQTMRERAAQALAAERSATAALTVFAGLGLLLAAVGVYGIMAYTVAQRRRDIGIRLALGLAPSEIRRNILLQGGTLALAGLIIGAVASLLMTRALSSLLAGVGPADPKILAIVVGTLMGVVLLACYLSARSATLVDPVESLAAE